MVMTATSRPSFRFALVVLSLGLLLPLVPGRAEAGHGGGFSVSIGFPYSFHFGHPYFPSFHVSYHPYSYWGYYPAAVPTRNDLGAIRLKVRPKKTEIFLDGDYLGRAGQYDGYPGYLWLEQGSHTLVFYRQGFRTFARSFEVRAGMITDVRVEMEPGETRTPEELLRRRQAAP